MPANKISFSRLLIPYTVYKNNKVLDNEHMNINVSFFFTIASNRYIYSKITIENEGSVLVRPPPDHPNRWNYSSLGKLKLGNSQINSLYFIGHGKCWLKMVDFFQEQLPDLVSVPSCTI
jgi:hypothetical protein